MARTTAALVKTIVVVQEGVSLTPFITMANIVVTNKCGSSGYDDTTLEMLERLLAAHFYIILWERRPKSSKVGASKEDYETSYLDKGLDSTEYGQQAMVLDTEGGLAQTSATQIGILWGGLIPDDWAAVIDDPDY